MTQLFIGGYVVEAINKNGEAEKEKIEQLIQKAAYPKIKLEVGIDNDIPDAIDKYIKTGKGELLTTFTHELNFFENFFTGSITRKLAYQRLIPLFTF